MSTTTRSIALTVASLFLWALAGAVMVASPSVAGAQGTLTDLITRAQMLVATAILPLMVLALLSFFLGVIQYLSASQKSADAAIKGRSVLVWGIIVLFVAVSIWGIVRLVRATFGI